MIEIEEIVRDYYLKPSLENLIALLNKKFKLITETPPFLFEFKDEKYILFINQANLINHKSYKEYINKITINDDKENSYIKIVKNNIEVYSEKYTIN